MQRVPWHSIRVILMLVNHADRLADGAHDGPARCLSPGAFSHQEDPGTGRVGGSCQSIHLRYRDPQTCSRVVRGLSSIMEPPGTRKELRIDVKAALFPSPRLVCPLLLQALGPGIPDLLTAHGVTDYPAHECTSQARHRSYPQGTVHSRSLRIRKGLVSESSSLQSKLCHSRARTRLR